MPDPTSQERAARFPRPRVASEPALEAALAAEFAAVRREALLEAAGLVASYRLRLDPAGPAVDYLSERLRALAEDQS